MQASTPSPAAISGSICICSCPLFFRGPWASGPYSSLTNLIAGHPGHLGQGRSLLATTRFNRNTTIDMGTNLVKNMKPLSKLGGVSNQSSLRSTWIQKKKGLTIAAVKSGG